MTKHKYDGSPGTGLHFGVFIPQVYPWPKMLALVQRAESLGFESFWLADHFVSPYQPEADWFDGWSLLAGLAAQTKTIRLGPLVTHIVYHNPAVLARQALTVDHISNGRLNLAIGAGGSRYCHEMTGVSLWEPAERSGRFKEAVEIVDSLLRQDLGTYEGEYYRTQSAQMNPSPIQKPRPPLTVAAHGPKALRLAATYGDCWNSYWPGADLTPEEASDITGQRNQRLTAFAQELGRDPAELRRSFTVGYSADTPFSTLEAFYEFIGRYRSAGINEFILGYVPGFEQFKDRWILDDEMLERIALEAIPALQRDRGS